MLISFYNKIDINTLYWLKLFLRDYNLLHVLLRNNNTNSKF